jgi:hypothetical protein
MMNNNISKRKKNENFGEIIPAKSSIIKAERIRTYLPEHRSFIASTGIFESEEIADFSSFPVSDNETFTSPYHLKVMIENNEPRDNCIS